MDECMPTSVDFNTHGCDFLFFHWEVNAMVGRHKWQPPEWRHCLSLSSITTQITLKLILICYRTRYAECVPVAKAFTWRMANEILFRKSIGERKEGKMGKRDHRATVTIATRHWLPNVIHHGTNQPKQTLFDENLN